MIVYIWGNLTADNFTPRPGKDTVAQPGRQPGISASETIPPGRKAQGIDTDKLKPPLRAIPDDIGRGGVIGHVSIAPIGEDGKLDEVQLEAGAGARGSKEPHRFTQILLDAVVMPNVKGPPP